MHHKISNTIALLSSMQQAIDTGRTDLDNELCNSIQVLIRYLDDHITSKTLQPSNLIKVDFVKKRRVA